MAANQPVAFHFTEEMKGFVGPGQTTFRDGYAKGKAACSWLSFHLTIKTEDLDVFLYDGRHEAAARGYVEGPIIGGRCPVGKGTFNLLVDTADTRRKRMSYRLHFHDTFKRARTLSGFKDVQDQFGFDVWRDTTTLFVNLFEDHVEEADETRLVPLAVGILRISMAGFAKQLTTIRCVAPTAAERAGAIARFGGFFLGSLWHTYASLPSFRVSPYQREIALYTTEGVTRARISTHSFATEDKLQLGLTRYLRATGDDVVLIVHGLTTSSDMFIMPEHYNLVQYLLDHGFGDVWTVDTRLSNRFTYNLRRHRYTLDDVALYDFPATIAELREHIGPGKRLHVITHCVGSIAFLMSLFAKQVGHITSVISNSVSLTPHVPRWSELKLAMAPFLCENVAGIQYANPLWRREPGRSVGKALATVVSGFHHECDLPECQMLSFMWGTGFPALYRHENLHPATHRRVGDLFGGTSFHYFRHILKMIRASHTAVKFDEADPKYSALPQNYFQHTREIPTPILFITGQDNRIFVHSNVAAFERLKELDPTRRDELHVFPNYGHQDVFQGRNCDSDVFPRLLEFLNEQAQQPRQVQRARRFG